MGNSRDSLKQNKLNKKHKSGETVMDFGKLLTIGQFVRFNYNGVEFKAEVIGTSCMDYERKYRIRFHDGSSRWVNQAMVRHVLTIN